MTIVGTGRYTAARGNPETKIAPSVVQNYVYRIGMDHRKKQNIG
jgi:hypothetical protein